VKGKGGGGAWGGGGIKFKKAERNIKKRRDFLKKAPRRASGISSREGDRSAGGGEAIPREKVTWGKDSHSKEKKEEKDYGKKIKAQVTGQLLWRSVPELLCNDRREEECGTRKWGAGRRLALEVGRREVH